MKFLKRAYLLTMMLAVCASGIPIEFFKDFSKGIHPWFYLIGFDSNMSPFTSNYILSNNNNLKIVSYGEDYQKRFDNLKDLDFKKVRLPFFYFFLSKAKKEPTLISRYAICQGLDRKYTDLTMFKAKAPKYIPEMFNLGLNVGQICTNFQ